MGSHPEQEDNLEYEVGQWMVMAEGMCQRAGHLRKGLEADKLRLYRRLETLNLDLIISDLPPVFL